jgi:3-hydroxyisobutyrate dehydrogenase-like beta-hydroxyacid dehydrogenase
MTREPIGILHPGEMGISIAATIQSSGYTVFWASDGRSAQTHARAQQFALHNAGTLANLCEICPVIVSVCPPHAAEAVAANVLAHGFCGTYVDANAISPERAGHMAERFTAVGASFVDGGIIGGPAWTPSSTYLYLSGSAANAVARYFAAGPLETVIIGESPGKASALKMCYAAWSKGTTALLAAVLAAAETLDVRAELTEQWVRDGSELAEGAAPRARHVTRKAWRFAGEMDEIANTFGGAGLPEEFHRAAANVYRRLAGFKGRAELPPLEEVLAALLPQRDLTGLPRPVRSTAQEQTD